MRDTYRRKTHLLMYLATVASLCLGGVGHARADFTFGAPAPLDPPINLGPVFSSFEGEWYPCISADALELYVTSDQPGGSGGGDLWVATRQSQDDLWGIQKRLPNPCKIAPVLRYLPVSNGMTGRRKASQGVSKVHPALNRDTCRGGRMMRTGA
jgi:hypothetical protein